MNRLLIFLPILCAFASCVKDKPNIQNSIQGIDPTSKKIYVVNEGNFNSSNASISLYDPQRKSVVEDQFYQMNFSYAGDVAQSMCKIGNDLYIVINNSGKVLVCDDGLKLKKVITGFTSPRYILQTGNSKAYVSDLYANKISIVDLNKCSIIGSIPCSGWTEQMILLYNRVFVTCLRSSYLRVIDPILNTIIDSVNVGPNTGSLVSDANDKIWVLSAGNTTASILPSLKRIHPVTLAVELNLEIPSGDPGNLCINRTRDSLYFINDGIYRVLISNPVISASPFIAEGSRNYYGLGISPRDYRIYASDALDYVQRSNVYVYDTDGHESNNFKAGINANGFYFE